MFTQIITAVYECLHLPVLNVVDAPSESITKLAAAVVANDNQTFAKSSSKFELPAPVPKMRRTPAPVSSWFTPLAAESESLPMLQTVTA